jgi:hypothetical protein
MAHQKIDSVGDTINLSIMNEPWSPTLPL